MNIHILETKDAMGVAAATLVVERIRVVLADQGHARIILATGMSQFEMLSHLVRATSVDWSKVTVFHLDEYLGLPSTHPSSFRRYLKERFVAHITGLGTFHYVDGDATDPLAECRRLGDLIQRAPIDVACIGIGENGHIAFNDPPADFETEEPYLVVNLDDACRRQQLSEGWFPTLDAVPRRAISMSIRQILRSRRIVCTVPDTRKARAIRDAVQGPLTHLCPASILRQHPDCVLFLDQLSAALLESSAGNST